MHLDTIQRLRSLALAYDDLVPIAKSRLFDLLDSYERHAGQEHTSVSESALELVHADMQGHVYGTDVGMNECAADDFLTWYQHFKNHDLGGSKVHEFDIHSVIDIMAEWLKAPFSLELPLSPPPRKYLIISEERRTHGMVWFYAPDSKGYTVCTARAGRYTEDEAAAILRGTVKYALIPFNEPVQIFELVDATSDEQYFPLGVFFDAASAVLKAQDHFPQRWDGDHVGQAVSEVRVRNIGLYGGSYVVLWRGEWHYDYDAGGVWKLVEQQTGTLEKPLPITRA